jgi:hypothetical protein
MLATRGIIEPLAELQCKISRIVGLRVERYVAEQAETCVLALKGHLCFHPARPASCDEPMKSQEDYQSTGLITASDIPTDQRHHLREYRSWKRFHRGPRSLAKPLLSGLSRYGNCVLVAGCQRSGTTMLTRVIVGSRGFQRFRLTHDDELDAALILAGHVDVPNDRRYCFQTTYLNERYPEYASMGPDQRLIWVLRNPYSVVHSMLDNWKRFALNELYESCGVSRANSGRQRRAKWPWPLGPSHVERACLSYSAKTAQILAIRELLRVDQLSIVDYDETVRSAVHFLKRTFAFIGEPFDPLYASSVQLSSVHKADRISERMRKMIDDMCLQTYLECLDLASSGTCG